MLPTDSEAFARLASLPLPEYDRKRKEEAKRLGIRPGTLDAQVAARRPRADTGVQGSAVEFPDVDPWETPVNGAQVLDEASVMFARYIVLPPGGADAMALWTMAAHAFEAFLHSPRLNF